MQFALGYTVLGGWNYPQPMFDAVPTAEELAPLLRFTRRAGFDGVDLADSQLNWFALSDADLGVLRRQIEDEGLVVAGLNPYRSILAGHPSAARNAERMRRTIEVAALLGARVVNIPLSVPFPAVWSEAARAARQLQLKRAVDYSDDDFATTAASLQAMADQAAAAGVALSIELHDDGMTDDSDSVLRVWRLVDRPNVGVNPDLQNLYRVPYPCEDWRRALLNLAPHTNFWHVKSNAKTYVIDEARTYSRGTSIVDGEIDYRWALTQMLKVGYDGWISIESGGGDSLEHATADMRYLRRLLAEWGPLVVPDHPAVRAGG
ncbi:MAG: sugar phosphate isomerase/epimerase [Chloroflexi bacterium]|nr:sugar phosphate isomerase/epimerase [Chloroflexota bacterium]